MPYNPDGDPDDLDPQDLEAVDAFLSDPGNVAMWERLGQQFRESPTGEQIAVLREALADSVARRNELAELVNSEAPREADPRRVLLTVYDAEVETITDRIIELMRQGD